MAGLLALLGLAGGASARLVDPTPSATTTTAATTVTIGSTAPATTGTTVAGTTSGPATTAAATTATLPAPTTPSRTVTIPPTTSAPTTAPAATTTAPASTTPAPFLATSDASTVLVVSGHGFGHGVGMSQWGAYGYARHGWGYLRILAHYYRGTTVAPGPSPVIRVLLADGRRRVTLDSASPWRVTDGRGTTIRLPPGPVTVGASLVVDGEALASPVAFAPGGTPLELGSAPYRGKLLLVSNGRRLQVVNALPLEQYLLGVVGSEMPSTWPAAALEAQAVAARSYALAQLENVVTASAFDVYSDTRSQVYGGLRAESPAVAAAVRATAREVVLYDGKVATTYYSSSSGGRTESAREAWGKPVPYLVSVADPYDTYSPYHDWGPVLIDANRAGRALEVPGQLVDLDVTPGPSGHVATVAAVGTKGTVSLTGNAVRSLLGLRSSWFSIGWLQLDRVAAPVVYGSAASLAGIARGVGAVALEARPAGGAWQELSPVAPGADGAFTVAIRPGATTQYRLAAGSVRAALVTVPVVPAVSAAVAAGTVQGTVRPPLTGAVVELQRQDGVGWTTVATATTDGSGGFSLAAELAPGSYRVRCAPGRGLSPGVSQPIQT